MGHSETKTQEQCVKILKEPFIWFFFKKSRIKHDGEPLF